MVLKTLLARIFKRSFSHFKIAVKCKYVLKNVINLKGSNLYLFYL